MLERCRARAAGARGARATSTTRELQARLPLMRTVEAAARGSAMVHDAGPATGRLDRLRRRFPDADAVVFGHSHIPLHEERDGFQIFNPGSPTERRRAPRHTMGIATSRRRRAALRADRVDPARRASGCTVVGDHLIVFHSAVRACPGYSRHDAPSILMDGPSLARDTEHGRAVTAQLTRRTHARRGDRGGRLRAQRRGRVQGHPPPGARGVRGLLLQPARAHARRRAAAAAEAIGEGSSCCPTRCTGRSRTSSSSSSTATTRSSTTVSRDRLEIEDLHRRLEDDCPEALVLPPRELYRVEAIAKSDEPGDPGWSYFLDLWTETGPGAPAHRGRARPVGRALPRSTLTTSCPDGRRLRASLAAAHGPLALLRRHRGLRAHAEARPARAAAARRRRADPVRLRRGHPAPAAALDRAARHRRDLHHPPAPRPLARAAGDDQDVRHARRASGRWSVYGPPGLHRAVRAGRCGPSSAAPATRSTSIELEPHEESASTAS